MILPIDERVAEAIIDSIQLHIVPIVIATDSWPNGGRYIDAGTASLIDTGKRKLCVTNNHVLSRYDECRSEHPNLIFEVCNHSIPIQDRIIHRVDDPDIATFWMTEEMFTPENGKNGVKKEYLKYSPWPPRTINVEEPIILVGFPGIFREKVESGQFGFHFTVFSEIVENVSDTHFSFRLDREHAIQIKGVKKLEEFTRFGGISGGLVVCAQSRFIIAPPLPIGIIYQAWEKLDIIRAHHLSLIDENGRIQH